jgi:two-component system, cell cycle response regulator
MTARGDCIVSLGLRVALLGFSKFERATFESFFRLAHKRQPSFTLATEAALCELAIVNADDDLSVAKVTQAGKLGVSLMLGAKARDGAAQQVPRPINLMLVVRALDQMAHALPEGPGSPEQAVPPPTAPTVAARVMSSARQPDPLAAMQPHHGEHWAGAPLLHEARAPAPATVVASSPPAPTGPRRSKAESARASMDHILVVDDSDIALRFMAQQLSRFGFEIHLARSGQEAIALVNKRHFEFVFLDVTMVGLDGFLTCKVIKRSDYDHNRQPPTVVMVTSRNTPVDRLRGTMAGADAYLTKPLDANELLKVVGDREVARHAFADTAQAASTLI